LEYPYDNDSLYQRSEKLIHQPVPIQGGFHCYDRPRSELVRRAEKILEVIRKGVTGMNGVLVIYDTDDRFSGVKIDSTVKSHRWPPSGVCWFFVQRSYTPTGERL
jgi:hypothetical protein